MTKPKKTRYDVPECIEQEVRENCEADLAMLERAGLISHGEVTSVEAIPRSGDGRFEFDVVVHQDIITIEPAHDIEIHMILGPPPMHWYWYFLPWKWKAIRRWRRFKAL